MLLYTTEQRIEAAVVTADFVEVDNRVWPSLEAIQQLNHQLMALSSLIVYDGYLYRSVWVVHVFAAFSA